MSDSTFNSLSDVCRFNDWPVNGTGIRKSKRFILDNKINIGKRIYPIKYPQIIKNCPVCQKPFTAFSGSPREKKTCSYSCSNTLFRKGNSKLSKKSTYRFICFSFHKKECLICREDKIVEVHHLDQNKRNNSPENLVPLCPNHHQYWHSKYKYLVEKPILEYFEKFKLEKMVS